MRAGTICVVIVAHALLAFMVTPVGWAVQDDARHVGVDAAVWIVRAFAMPSFFWLAGYLGRATVSRVGWRGFVRERLGRVALPLLVALVPVSLALNRLWDLAREHQGGRAAAAAQAPRLHASELPVTLGHLWFLYYLLIISGVALAVVLLWRRLVTRPLRPRALTGLAVALTAVAVLADGKLQPDTPLSFLPEPLIAAHFGVFFAWGWWAEARGDDLAREARQTWVHAACACALLAIVIPALRRSVVPGAGAPGVLALVASAGFTCTVLASLVGACTRWLSRPRPAIRLVSDAAFWAYVVHLPVVVLLQLACADLAWPGPLEAALVSAGALAFSLLTFVGARTGWRAARRPAAGRSSRTPRADSR
ncbi:MAG: acyltransferase [Deltaproteobacteria bacterium]|nr:acyltransferase [Deltaproteobacteria bacterium]